MSLCVCLLQITKAIDQGDFDCVSERERKKELCHFTLLLNARLSLTLSGFIARRFSLSRSFAKLTLYIKNLQKMS